MNMNPEVIDMIAKFVAVNVVATLLLALMSFTLSAFMLNRLAAFDRWLGPTQTMVDDDPRVEGAPSQPSGPLRGSGA